MHFLSDHFCFECAAPRNFIAATGMPIRDDGMRDARAGMPRFKQRKTEPR